MYDNITQLSAYHSAQLGSLLPLRGVSNFHRKLSTNPKIMWRNAVKQASLRRIRSHDGSSSLPTCSFLVLPSNSEFGVQRRAPQRPNGFKKELGQIGSCSQGLSSCEGVSPGLTFNGFSGNLISSMPYRLNPVKSLASVAEVQVEPETVSSEEEGSVIDEMQGLLEELGNGEHIKDLDIEKKRPRKKRGKGQGKYFALRRRQIKIETEAWDQAAKEYKELLADMCERKLAPNLPYMKSLFLGWFEPLRDSIAAEQQLCAEAKCKPSHAPYFLELPPDMMSVITMHKLMGLLMTGGEHGSARVVQAACQIGEAIEQEARIHRFLEKTKKKNDKKKKDKEEPEPALKQQEFLRNKVTSLIKKQKHVQANIIVKGLDPCKPWGQEAQAKVGSRLIELLIQTAYIQPPVGSNPDGPPDIRPAFRHTLKNIIRDQQKTSRRCGIIECDPIVHQGLDRTAKHMVIPYIPMLVPPLKWSGYDKGAHLFLPSYVMRTHGARQQRQAIKQAPREQLLPVFEALDTLGNTKWRVNKRILSVIDRIWASGGRLADLVDRDDVPLPEHPDTEDEALIKKWKWQVKSVKKENSERHSQRCDIELKLAVARKMKDEEGFFYPHNLDFRGRAYPMHPYLNHLGSDICRGILEFAEGRPLGKSGLRWLKIHLANLYAGGVDKFPYDGRLAFTENHLDDIFDSADRPLEGRRWWLGAEDPFQCLAVCINLTEALRSSSPETTISHMPVHQDGSCNGLQHYAALGRDKLGAAAVNLIAGEKPADVYSGIASRVLEIMKLDAAKDPEKDPNAKIARVLVKEVDRKLVKQTVMTSVYGVTYIGARDQIKKRLTERNTLSDDKERFVAACYAAKVTLTALGEMFQAARDIMSWLGDCAKVIASENQPVRWTTPLGLPVVQPYRAAGRHLIKTSLQVLTLKRETDKIMVKRQRTAFPPNFVHSLDGSHMMMTALACKKAGLSFAGVHDSYWTHACDVDQMSSILREKFVELYEQPILENVMILTQKKPLKTLELDYEDACTYIHQRIAQEKKFMLLESFQKSFPELSFPPLPERGDFDLKEVLNSTYFFN